MDKKIEVFIITVLLYSIGVSVVPLLAVTPNAPLFAFMFCAVGGGILFNGCIGFYALRMHTRVKGQYEAFYRLFTFMYALGWVSVVVVGTADSIGTPTPLLFLAVVVSTASLLYVAVYSVQMQNVRPSVPYLLNSRVYPAQSTFSVSLCEQVAPFTGWVEVGTTLVPTHNATISAIELWAHVPVPTESIPPQGVPLQTIQADAKQELRHTVEQFFAREVTQRERCADEIIHDLTHTLSECGFCKIYHTVINAVNRPLAHLDVHKTSVA